MEVTYCKNINGNVRFTLRAISPLIKRAIQERTACCMSGEAGDYSFIFSFNPDQMRLSVSFKEEDGEEVRRKIKIAEERSNLPNSDSSVFYFLCPATGRKCRTLYKFGSFFCSRGAVRGTLYPNQMMSRSKRKISYRESPYRKGGKVLYRGKLTPYGKRCLRYEELMDERYNEILKFSILK